MDARQNLYRGIESLETDVDNLTVTVNGLEQSLTDISNDMTALVTILNELNEI